MDVELYSHFQSWPGETIPHIHLPFGENCGIPLTLSITTTDQSEQGNHYFAVDRSGRRKASCDSDGDVDVLILDMNGYDY
jgi:hypothetical protein